VGEILTAVVSRDVVLTHLCFENHSYCHIVFPTGFSRTRNPFFWLFSTTRNQGFFNYHTRVF